MRASTFFLALFRFLLPPALIATCLLYLYPAVQLCSFPSPAPPKSAAVVQTQCFFNGSSSSAAPESSGESSGAGDSPHSLPRIAPFRLLALGDPQLEGDTSLPSRGAKGSSAGSLSDALHELRARLQSEDASLSAAPALIRQGARDLVAAALKDASRALRTWRKKLDLWGNDLYLAHVYRSMAWWTAPTHTVVLGDLVGSQWISDEEFERRADRFWGRVFRGMEKVPDEVMDAGSEYNLEGREDEKEKGFEAGAIEGEHAFEEEEEEVRSRYIERTTTIGSEDWKAWEKRLINVAGNHDIGYAGDIDTHRIERFERRFGRVNWNLRFTLPPSTNTSTTSTSTPSSPSNPLMNSAGHLPQPQPELELVILNDMNLDRPAWNPTLQAESWAFLDEVIERTTKSRTHATVLLTHIPLYKPEGICVDGPFVTNFPASQGGGIREQNHLSWLTSRLILDGFFGGDDRRGVVLNGHDHEGCDTVHQRPRLPSLEEEQAGWSVARSEQHDTLSTSTTSDDNDDDTDAAADTADIVAVRELTVRSMMGDYGGNAGLLSGWFDETEGAWRFEYASCALGVQHIWWAVHALDVVVSLLGLAGLVAVVVEALRDARRGVEVLETQQQHDKENNKEKEEKEKRTIDTVETKREE